MTGWNAACNGARRYRGTRPVWQTTIFIAAASLTRARKPASRSIPHDAGHGFRINANARNIILDTCEFADNRGLGVQVNGSDNSPANGLLFVHCQIRNNRKAAVAIWPGYRALTWRDCLVQGNAENTLPPARGASPPVRVVTMDAPAHIRAGKSATFDVRETGVGGKPASVLWDFGDGIPVMTANAVHVFAHPGRYRVTLLTWDRQGHAAHSEKTVTVQ